MFHKVKEIKALPDYFLFVKFENNEEKQYNVKSLVNELEPFKALLYIPGLFEQVKVDSGGYGISWNDELDLACDELYYNGHATVTDTREPHFS